MAAKIVTIYNQKGGAGKTATTMNLAGTFGRNPKNKVMIIDMDPQQTSTLWHSHSKGSFPAHITYIHPEDKNLLTVLKDLSEKYDFIFIDCPPSKDYVGAKRAILVSDLMIIPFMTSAQDVFAAMPIIALGEESKITNPSLKVMMLPCQYKSNNNHGIALINQLNNDPRVQLFRTSLGDRTSYKDCFLYGSTVHGVPNSKKSILEVESLVTEVNKILKAK